MADAPKPSTIHALAQVMRERKIVAVERSQVGDVGIRLTLDSGAIVDIGFAAEHGSIRVTQGRKPAG